MKKLFSTMVLAMIIAAFSMTSAFAATTTTSKTTSKTTTTKTTATKTAVKSSDGKVTAQGFFGEDAKKLPYSFKVNLTSDAEVDTKTFVAKGNKITMYNLNSKKGSMPYRKFNVVLMHDGIINTQVGDLVTLEQGNINNEEVKKGKKVTIKNKVSKLTWNVEKGEEYFFTFFKDEDDKGLTITGTVK